eukprot:3651129-Pyramimonas_sp.AAC.1
MRRPSRRPNFGRTPCVWSHVDGLSRSVDPANHSPAECLTEADYQPIAERYPSDRSNLAAPRSESPS